MASNYPDSFDSLDDPAGTDPLSNPAHAALHVSENDAIEAVQATLGLNPEGSYATVAERMSEVDTAAAAAQAAQVAAELAQAAAEGASTDAGDAANLAEDWAIQLGDPVSGGEYSAKYHAQAAAASVLDAQDAVGLAADSAAAAFTALGNANAQVTASRQARRFGADGSVLTNLPMQVDPAESLLKTAVWWIDAAHSSASGQSVSNLGWGGAALDAQLGSTGSADSNDPKYLDWTGENYCFLPGVVGNYLRAPTTADISGDFDLICRLVMDDWTPSSNMDLITKWTSPSQFWFYIDTAGKLNLRIKDGTDTQIVFAASANAVPFAGGASGWVKASLDVDNGASGSTVTYSSSPDGLTWSVLGTSTVASSAALYPSTSDVILGTRDTVNGLLAAKVHRAQVLNGIDGTPVLDIDCSQISSGSDTSFPARTGQQVSINRSTSGRKAVAVTQPVWLFGTDDYMEVADHPLLNFGASDSFTVLAVVRSWGNFSGNDYILAKRIDGTTVGWMLVGYSGSRTVAVNIHDGTSTNTSISTSTSGGLDVMAGVRNVAGDTLGFALNDAALGTTTDTTTGTLANSYAMRVGTNPTSTFYSADMEFIAAAIFRRALSAEEIRLISDYYQGNGYEPISPAKYTNEDALPAAPESGTLVFNQQTEQLLLEQGGSWSDVLTAKSALRVLPEGEPPAEKLLKQAVWWIDANEASAGEQSVRNLGWGASALDARLGSASGADSNDPKFLDWDGENYVYLPGVGSNYLSVPDEAALDITGDIDVIARIRVDAGEGIMAKSNVFNQRSWEWRYSSGNGFSLELSSDGSTMTSVNAGAAFPYAFGETCWVRFTWEAASGDTKFYTQDDSLSEPSTWTQLGTTKTANIGSIYSGSAPVNIGARTSSISLVTGAIHRAIIKDGIDGTPVLDVDCSQITSGSNTSFTALTGQTVTINRSTSGRKTVGVVHPRWLFGTDDYMEVPDNDLLDFGASDSFTVLAVVRQWDNTVSFGRYLDKSAGATDGLGWTLSGRTDNTLYAGIDDGPNVAFRSAISPFVVGATSVVGLVVDRTLQTLATFSDGNVGATTSTSAVGSIANSLPLRIGRTADTSGYQHFEGTAFAVFRRALTAGEIATLTDYYKGRR